MDLKQSAEAMVKEMRFMGIVYILRGAFVSLSIIGAILGVPMIIAGIRIREAADRFDAYNVDQDEDALRKAFLKTKESFAMQKIEFFITLAFFVLMILFYGAVIIALLSGNMGDF